MLLFEKPKEIYRDVEWLTIFFFIGLFIIIGGFEANGGIKFLADQLIVLTHGSLELATMVILWASGILSVGACLGGNLTIIGAAANVLVSETSASRGHKISFLRFMKYGALITFISLVLSSFYLYFRYLR